LLPKSLPKPSFGVAFFLALTVHFRPKADIQGNKKPLRKVAYLTQ
jgi:hypothetical protein